MANTLLDYDNPRPRQSPQYRFGIAILLGVLAGVAICVALVFIYYCTGGLAPE
jgi:hypothetical protein